MTTTVPVTSPPAAVPTLSEWLMALLAATLALAGVLKFKP
jgi:hypothetical protein